MMKKIFSAMMAFAMIFATSCQNDLDSAAAAGDTSAVSFKVSTPEIATRAYSDGTTATVLKYAVYDEAGTYLDELGGETTINLSTKVDLQLVTGNSYTVIFWAAAADAPYTVDFATKTMTVDYAGAKSNAENRDAFYARHDFTVNGAQTEDVILYRPFAQLNIGANDYEAASKAGYEPQYSAVTVKSIYKKLNFFTGEVSEPTEAVFDYEAIPSGEEFPVEGCEYLAMNYLLVDNVKELIEVEFKYTETDDAASKSRTVGSVPVQRNYRTNIYGQLFTSDVDINVVIEPAFNEPDYEADKLFVAAAIGGEYTLNEDVEISSTLKVQSSLILNLNGHTLKNKVGNAQTDVIIVSGDATLTINGEGTVEAVTGNDGYAAIAEGNASLIINGGTFKAGVDADGATNAVIYARGNGKVFVNGGNFPNENNTGFVLNKKDSDRATTTIEVKGGTFTNFNPANNAAEGAGTNFVADGYAVAQIGNDFVVGKAASNVDELKSAINADPVVNFAGDVDNGSSVLAINGNDVTINMSGKEYKAGGQGTNNYAFNVFGSDVVVNDANMNGAGFAVLEGSSVTVNSGAIAAKPGKSGRNMFYVVGNSTVTVNEGTYTFDRTSCYFVYVEAGSTCYINGGTFTKPLANNASKDSFVNNASAGTVIITGGTFNVDPTNWVADGYVATKSGKYWTVTAE